MVLCCDKFKRKNQLKIRDLECKKKGNYCDLKEENLYVLEQHIRRCVPQSTTLS